MIIYYDGYGYNFYYGDFGYYEYSLNDAPPGVNPTPVYYGGGGGGGSGAAGIIVPIVCVCCICCCMWYCKNKNKVNNGEGGESEDTDMQNQFELAQETSMVASNLDISNIMATDTDSKAKAYQMGAGIKPIRS